MVNTHDDDARPSSAEAPALQMHYQYITIVVEEPSMTAFRSEVIRVRMEFRKVGDVHEHLS